MQPAAEDPEVVVEVGPGGRWVAEYYPHDSAEELADGGLRITLRTPDPSSLRRLALRLGRDGRIVSPLGLAESARQAAGEALAAYDGQGSAVGRGRVRDDPHARGRGEKGGRAVDRGTARGRQKFGKF